ncbi:MAG TPA: hypothetical protein VF984_07200 [Actinomycetota bacterium]
MNETAFSLRSTDPALLEVVDRYLGAHAIQAPVKGERYYRFSADCGEERSLPGVRRAKRVGSLYMNTLRVFRVRGLEEMAGRFISTIRDIATFASDEYVRIRAGAVAFDGRVVLLPSPPEPHLPALVGGLVRTGAALLGDEIALIEPVLRDVHPLGLPILVGVEDRGLFADVLREEPASQRKNDREGLEQIRYAILAQDLGGRVAETAPVGWFVFPRFELGGPTRLEAIGGSEALFEFARAGLNFHVWGERALILGREMLASVPVRRLRVGSVADAVTLLRDLDGREGGAA